MDVPQEPKVKRAMNPQELERNERRKKAFEELKRINPKARWVDASKLVGYRNRGDKNSEVALLKNIATKNSGTKKANAVPAAPSVAAQSAWKNIKAQVNKDVLESGMKLNGIDRRALATSRKLNPGLSVANFMRNRVPHKRRTKKVNVAAPVAPSAAAQSAWKNIKAQVNKNVLESGMKLNGIDRRALATSRKLNPGLSVANFMRNRVPHKRRTKKVVPKNSYNIQKAKNKAIINYYNQKRVRQEKELLNFKPQANSGRLQNFFNRS